MKFLINLLLVLVVNVMMVSAVPNQGKGGFVGAKKCSMCHKKESDGSVYQNWQKSRHAKAFQTLNTKEAEEVAKKLKIKTKPSESAECLSCHVTGYNVDKQLLTESYSREEGVQCETCHGGGEKYKTFPIMKDIKQAVANGLTEYKNEADIKKNCLECHNKKSPTYKEFKFKEMYDKIKHGKKS